MTNIAKNGKEGFYCVCLILLLVGKDKPNSIQMSDCHFVLLIPSKLFRTLLFDFMDGFVIQNFIHINLIEN